MWKRVIHKLAVNVLRYLPKRGTAEAVGGAASTKIKRSSNKLPNIVKPGKTEKNLIELNEKTSNVFKTTAEMLPFYK